MGYPHAPHPKETVVLSKYFGDPEARTYDGWVARGGYKALEKALSMDRQEIIDAVKEAGLRGRGGAGFPAGVKWGFMPKEKQGPHYLCCNADESEPGTFKDREIMRWTPHGLIEGIAIAQYAMQAEVAYIYVRGEFPDPQAHVIAALKEAYDKGVLGPNAMGSGNRIDIYVHSGAGAYICGEETALMNSIEGRRGNPRIRPPFPAARGLFGRPTTINNVETLTSVPYIIGRGAAWYRSLSLSNERSTGTKLFCVSGHVQKPGNYEVEMGFPLKDLIYELCGGIREGRTLKACIPGGSSVPILNKDETETCLLDYEGVQAVGSMLGSGAVIVMDDSTDMVYQVMRLAQFYAHESCAQCVPCREGTAWMLTILRRILAGQGKAGDLDLLLDLSEQMTGRTICPLCDSCAVPVVSGINKFREEFDAYINGSKPAVLAAV